MRSPALYHAFERSQEAAVERFFSKMRAKREG